MISRYSILYDLLQNCTENDFTTILHLNILLNVFIIDLHLKSLYYSFALKMILLNFCILNDFYHRIALKLVIVCKD